MIEEIVTVTVSQLGVNDREVELIEWCVSDKDEVSIGDILCILETAKATFEIKSEVSGYIVFLVDDGSEVEINQVIALISTNLNELRKEKEKYISKFAVKIKKKEYIQAGIKATKKARKLALELDVDLTNISVEGIIKERDVLNFYNSRKYFEKKKLEIIWDKNLKPVVIYGAGRGAITLKECIDLGGLYQVVCFIDDDYDHPPTLSGLPVYHSSRLKEILKFGVDSLATEIANGNFRLEIAKRCDNIGIDLMNIIHPETYISPSANIGRGNYIKAGAVIETNTVIGDCCIIDNGVVIAHDNIIGNGCHIAPGVSMGSGIEIGDFAIIGIGSSLTTNLKIGKGAIISVGSSVTKDVLDYCIIEGVPGKVIGKSKIKKGV